VRLPEPAFIKEFLGDPKERVPCLMDPLHPVMSGVVQNQDSYMKGKVAQRFFTDRVMGFVREAMKTHGAATGRRLNPVRSYRIKDAEVAILTMGSMSETLRATVDWAARHTDLRIGAVQLLCFRPFPAADLVRALAGVRAIAVIGRMDDPMAGSNLLVAEVKAAFADALSGRVGMPRVSQMPRIHCGIAGLGSRDVRPGHFIAAAKNLYERGKRDFVLGIEHELALPIQLDPDVRPPGAFSMRGYSVGGFGSVATNKIIATVTAQLFDLHVQAYPFYGSEKKGLPTRYFLTAADQPIRMHSELHQVEFVPLSAIASFNLGNPLEGRQGRHGLRADQQDRSTGRLAGGAALRAPSDSRARPAPALRGCGRHRGRGLDAGGSQGEDAGHRPPRRLPARGPLRDREAHGAGRPDGGGPAVAHQVLRQGG
jgi:pyruvate-ferredoxin/flavodoxin oxidoreductase